MGGAYSIDKLVRIEGVSWWSDELPSNEEYNEAISYGTRCVRYRMEEQYVKLTDIFGAERFYDQIDEGLFVKKTSLELTSGELYEQNGNLIYEENGVRTVLASDVGEWLEKDGQVIFNHNYPESWMENGFWITNYTADYIYPGGISPNGDMVYYKDRYLYKGVICPEKKLVENEIPAKSLVYFTRDLIYFSTDYEFPKVNHCLFYDFGGNVKEKESLESLRLARLSFIQWSLTGEHKYRRAWKEFPDLDNDIDITQFGDDIISLETVDKVADMLKNYNILSVPAYAGYNRIRDFLLNIGYHSGESIEESLVAVMGLSQTADTIGLPKNMFCSAGLLKALNNLKNSHTQIELKSVISDSFELEKHIRSTVGTL